MPPLPAPWAKKKAFLGLAASSLALAMFFVLQSPTDRQGPLMHGGIPIPFGSNGSTLPGSVTYFGQRNSINVYEVIFDHNEVSEHLGPDKIYLVHVPNDLTVTNVPLDLALSLTPTGEHLVDYYGYRYSDAAATMERRDTQAFLFQNRFPGQFFASKTARDSDAAHGNMIAAFEAARNVTFLKTDNSPGAVRVDPLGALYVLVVNSAQGAEISVRDLKGCGNHLSEAPEQCDDGNTDETDTCDNACRIAFPIPFDGDASATGAHLFITQFSATAGEAEAGASSIPLLRFTAIAGDLTKLTRLAFVAEIGSLTSLEHYKLWQDTNGDGVTDLPISFVVVPVGNTLTFNTPTNWSGALVRAQTGTIFELKADVPAGLVGTSSLRIGFATSTNDFVVAKREAGTFPLLGIGKDGVCTFNICQISVTTASSPLWTLVGSSMTSSSSSNSVASSESSSSASSVASSESSSDSSSSQASSAASSSPSICGNGVVDQGEECDDAGPDCDNTCHLTVPTPNL